MTRTDAPDDEAEPATAGPPPSPDGEEIDALLQYYAAERRARVAELECLRAERRRLQAERERIAAERRALWRRPTSNGDATGARAAPAQGPATRR